MSEGTPAARMKKVASNIVKKRSRELTSVFESFTPYNGMEGNMERIWITDIATDEIHLVSKSVRKKYNTSDLIPYNSLNLLILYGVVV